MTIDAELVRGAGDLWKQSGRIITASFGGRSMEPSILAGEPLRIACGRAFAPGDVVMFFHLDRMVVHRVVAMNRESVLTAGDAHRLPDPFLVPRGTIVGVVQTVTRGGAEVAVAAPRTSPARRMLMAAFVILFKLVPEAAVVAVRIWRAIRFRAGRIAGTP
jgi:hypothetical protein